ncbi:MAG TPA: hypothetical protein DDZ96_14310 [Porphyromonadaceae bacterium]|jgi:hypothetical protein|uniref:winged helix-turn-helix domain-containing protein n=1 Tax=Limibacterium fermenti TaxID=3229863 RepID=UPI000E8F3CAF|nr:hypothetical protein [Porphyromonadaceae bacterium]HBL34965.1 hypothetical protein [Porphyromonadaceae bacterium]HBX45329.1 hypothetical protein [Porphyromonadaceae bacterium]
MNADDIGRCAGVIWQLLDSKGPMAIRQIGEQTSYKDSWIYLSLGWLSRENKIWFSESNGVLFVGLDSVFPERYY